MQKDDSYDHWPAWADERNRAIELVEALLDSLPSQADPCFTRADLEALLYQIRQGVS